MALGDNVLPYFQTLGNNTITNGIATNYNYPMSGAFTWPPTTPVKSITVHEAEPESGTGQSTHAMNDPVAGSGVYSRNSENQTITAAENPAWIGKIVSAIQSAWLYDSLGVQVGTVHLIGYDSNGDGNTHNNPGAHIGYVISLLPSVTSLAPGNYTFSSSGIILVQGMFAYDDVICFCRGTRIKTINGEVAVEDLRSGDQVFTMDEGYQPLRWTGAVSVTSERLGQSTNLRPIRIRQGALGGGLPEADLTVSPQHRVLLRSKVAERMFNSREILVPAKDLLGMDGVTIAEDLASVEYFHILFDRHQIVYANGAPTESLYTGPEAMKSLPEASRAEILELFPEIATPEFHASLARPVPKKGKERRQMVQRIVQNEKAALEEV